MTSHAVMTRMPRGALAGRWRWCRVMKNERLVRGRGDTDLSTCPACDSFVKPNLLKEGGVLHQAQQCGPRRHQRLARLLLRQPVQAAIEFTAVLVEECLELATGWLIDDILSERRWKGGHKRSISERRPRGKYRSSAIRASANRTVCAAAYRSTVGPGTLPLAGADPCHQQRLRTVAGCGDAGSRAWTGSPDNPSAASAICAIARAMGAASACAAAARALVMRHGRFSTGGCASFWPRAPKPTRHWQSALRHSR